MSTLLGAAAIEQMKSICGPLHEALQHGAEQADAMVRAHGLVKPEHDWHRHNHARLLAGIKLAGADLAPWKVLKRGKTGSLVLVNKLMTIRVLRPLVGQAPIPGPSKARQAYYTQDSIADLPATIAIPQLTVSRFVATWDVVDAETYEVGIQVYRTTGTFKIGQPAKADLAFWLPNNAADFEDMTFEPSDDHIELPIPEEGTDAEQSRR